MGSVRICAGLGFLALLVGGCSGGQVTLTPAGTRSATPTPKATATASPAASPGSSASATPTPAPTSTAAPSATPSLAPSSSPSPTASPSPSPSPASMVFVADQGDEEILGFRTTSNGNVAPVSVIAGSNTMLSPDETDGFHLAFDGVSSLYAGVNTPSGSTYAAIFPAGATGNIAPSATLTLPGVFNSFDAAGHLFDASGTTIDIFAKGAMGSATPIGTISGSATGLTSAGNSVVDSNGTLYVINYVSGSNAYFEILTFAHAASANGNVPPTAVLSGTNTMLSDPTALAIDSAGRLIVADTVSGILTFGQGATGNVAPVGVIAGSATDIGAPYGVAVDPSNNIWESGQVAPGQSGGQLLEFAAGSNGNVPPIARITGSATTLGYPVEIVFVPGADVQQSTRRRPLEVRPIRR